MTCRYCGGRGWEHLEGGRSYPCGDCGGTGVVEICERCCNEYAGEYCEVCYVECDECGEIVLIEKTADGLCENCAAMEDENE